MDEVIPVVDLFAGPGGLGEGFNDFAPREGPGFSVALSIERDKFAHKTLLLRTFFRRFPRGEAPKEYYELLARGGDPKELGKGRQAAHWQAAAEVAMKATLGASRSHGRIFDALRQVRDASGGRPIVVIGGPPCQAYSVVGRARNKGVKGYELDLDKRSHLYREYLKVIEALWPAVFVMENVLGMLSSEVGGERVFGRITEDLSRPSCMGRANRRVASHHRYSLFPVVEPPDAEAVAPKDYVVQCDAFGVPQRRHRVFILGVRDDLLERLGHPPVLLKAPGRKRRAPTVREAIGDLPPVRSYVSWGRELEVWTIAVQGVARARLLREIREAAGKGVATRVKACANRAAEGSLTIGGEFVPLSADAARANEASGAFHRFVRDRRLKGCLNHSTRGHIPQDLWRYLYASCYAAVHRRSPRLSEFPKSLLPRHRNAARAARTHNLFTDRFRVQLAGTPASTVTSHIAKDGHYYIHYDPLQCRALTVREAARLQTFPDNYFFCGPRTEQYTQVGNAVPPLMARRIAGLVHRVLSAAGVA